MHDIGTKVLVLGSLLVLGSSTLDEEILTTFGELQT